MNPNSFNVQFIYLIWFELVLMLTGQCWRFCTLDKITNLIFKWTCRHWFHLLQLNDEENFDFLMFWSLSQIRKVSFFMNYLFNVIERNSINLDDLNCVRAKWVGAFFGQFRYRFRGTTFDCIMGSLVDIH